MVPSPPPRLLATPLGDEGLKDDGFTVPDVAESVGGLGLSMSRIAFIWINKNTTHHNSLSLILLLQPRSSQRCAVFIVGMGMPIEKLS